MQLLVELIQQADKELAALKDRKQQIKAQLAKLPIGTAAGRVPPQYQQQFERLRNALKAVDSELAMFYDRVQAAQDEREFQDHFAKQRLSITPQERSQQQGMAIKQGFQKWNDLRTKYGNDDGIEQAILDTAKHLTVNGNENLNVEQLAQHFNIPLRTMYKWLERPHLASLRYLLPNKQ